MKNLEIIKKKIRNLNENWTWWGQRAHDALGLKEFINFERIISCDWGREFKDLWNPDRIISIEKKEGIRRNYSNEDINSFLKSIDRQEFKKLFKNNLTCLMYRSVNKLEKIKAASGEGEINIYSAPVHLKNTFDNKIFLRDILNKLKLPRLPGKILRLQKYNYKKIVRKLGEKFVVQYPVGSSGKNTHLINNRKAYRKIQKKYGSQRSPVIATGYLEGYPVNINAVVGRDNIHISLPSLQIIGQKVLNPHRFGFSGNDYSAGADLPLAIKDSIIKITGKIGNFMKKYGFLGMMGIDFIVHKNRVYPVEINPRFQNSTSLLTLLEIARDTVPLVYYHIAQFNSNLNIYDAYSRGNMAGNGGAQLILHNLEGSKITLGNGIKPGVYRLDGKNNLKFIRKGYSVLDLKDNCEFAVCGGVPPANCVVKKDAPLLKIHFKKSVYKNKFRELKPEIELTAKKIYNKIVSK
ncbi:MAG: ATP-grasp domain-containing protein [Elusimicrobiota bacterium]